MGKKLFFWYLILSVLFVSLAPRLDAMFVTTDHSLNTAEDLLQIRKVLEKKVVSQRLLDLGFSPGEVGDRVSALTDKQIHDIALQLQQVKVGGAAEGVLIGILVIILVILLVLPLAGIRVWYDGKR
jgi:hypothetical protein